jgi:DNA polymerase
MLLKKLETLHSGTRADGTFPFALKYFGAATGRWSGEGVRFNMQNLPKDPDKMFDVDLRSMLLPDEGCRFVIADLAQIEARLLLWAVGDTSTLEHVRAGVSVYEAHARATMGWTGGVLKKEDPALYSLAKARVLGSGYGCGGPKFRVVAKTMAGLDLTPEAAQKAIDEYRAANPKITGFWARLDRWFAQSAVQRLSKHNVLLPSGRRLPYWLPRMSEREKSAMFQFGNNRKKAYGGLLTENYIQATARDVLVHIWLELERRGLPVRWTVHDETVNASAPIADADEIAKETEEVFSRSPEWLEGCPIAGEVAVKDCYTK